MDVGDVLADRYELLEEIGAGGMGRVLRARDRTLDRDVAVKLLVPYLLGDEDAVAALRDEARRAAAVRHPNVVQVLDAVLDGTDQPAIVMEHVDGPSLSDVIPTDGMEVGEALDVLRAVGSGLAAVHASGLVHRDVTPGNVLLDGGVPRLTDFGIARSASAAATTTIRGSVSYLAPEQADATPIGPSADVYALGCLATTLLTGRPPFSATHPVAVVHKHLNEPVPDVRDRAPDVPPEVAAGIAAALQKDPADRPGSVLDLLDAWGLSPGAAGPRTTSAPDEVRPRPTTERSGGATAATQVIDDPDDDERILGPLLLAALAILLLAWLAIAGLGGSGGPETAPSQTPAPSPSPSPSPTTTSPSPSPVEDAEEVEDVQDAEVEAEDEPGGPPADAGPPGGPPGQSGERSDEGRGPKPDRGGP